MIKKKKNNIIKLCVLAVLGIIAFNLLNQQISISSKKKQLAQIQEEIQLQEIKNRHLREVMNSEIDHNDEHIRKIARKQLGFADRSERVFVNV